MTYSPGGPGYPPAQASGSYGAATSSSFAKPEDGESKLPQYLTAATAVLGLLAYVVSFGVSAGGGLALIAAVLATLLAAVSLLPKARNYTAIVAVVAVLGALMMISQLLTSTSGFSTGWAQWVLVGLTVVQAIVAVGTLLLDAGILTAPVPRPKYDQYSQYGLPPGGYYGQSGPHQQHASQQQQQQQQQNPQRSGPNPGYQSQYGGYPSASSTGGFDAFGQQQAQQLSQQQTQQLSQHQGAPTPPTGFPSFSPPPAASGSGQGPQGPSAGDQGQGGYGYGDSGHGQQPNPSSSEPNQS